MRLGTPAIRPGPRAVAAVPARVSPGLVELPRDHGKSTVCGRILWELGRNPALRVKIVCALTRSPSSAAASCGQIERNGRLRDIFPNKAGAPWRWNRSRSAPGDVIGPSVQAFGVGEASTGTRADLLVCDDIVDVRAPTPGPSASASSTTSTRTS